MDFVPFSLDPRDIVYMVAGLAFLGLTFQPGLSQFRLANIPFFYVLIGAALAFAGIPAIDPNAGGLSAKVVEHAAELIVIISLAGAGLAIDTRESWKNWNPTFRLLLISMPLTIVAVFLLGHWVVGLDWPSAMLLAAALAPTDPVLARSVQVGPPGRKEKPMEVALTAEAGLNDGLAFPFVYLAIAAATFAYAGDGFPQWIWGWFGYDLLYRVIAGWCIGHAIGHVISKVIYSRFGDASHGGWNAMLVVLAATLISYGITETFDAYGFLAVFAAARAGRANSRGTEKSRYEKYVHHGADQLESILLALMLLWFGMFIASGGLAGLTWVEVALALVILLLCARRVASCRCWAPIAKTFNASRWPFSASAAWARCSTSPTAKTMPTSRRWKPSGGSRRSPFCCRSSCTASRRNLCCPPRKKMSRTTLIGPRTQITARDQSERRSAAFHPCQSQTNARGHEQPACEFVAQLAEPHNRRARRSCKRHPEQIADQDHRQIDQRRNQ